MPANCDGGITSSTSPLTAAAAARPEVPPSAPGTRCQEVAPWEGRRNQRRPSRTRLIRAPRTGPCVEEELRVAREELSRLEKEKLAAQDELKEAARWGEDMLKKLQGKDCGVDVNGAAILAELEKARAEVRTHQIRADAYQESLEAARAALMRKAKEKADIEAQRAEASDTKAERVRELEQALEEAEKAVQDCKTESAAIEDAKATKIKILERELIGAQQAMQSCSVESAVDRAAIEEARAFAAKAEAALEEARRDAAAVLEHQAALASQVSAAEEKASQAFQAAKEALDAKAQAEALAAERAAQAEAAAVAAVTEALAEAENEKKLEQERAAAAQLELEKAKLENEEAKALAQQLALEAEAIKAQMALLSETLTPRRADLNPKHQKVVSSDDTDTISSDVQPSQTKKKAVSSQRQDDVTDPTKTQIVTLDTSDKVAPKQSKAKGSKPGKSTLASQKKEAELSSLPATPSNDAASAFKMPLASPKSTQVSPKTSPKSTLVSPKTSPKTTLVSPKTSPKSALASPKSNAGVKSPQPRKMHRSSYSTRNFSRPTLVVAFALVLVAAICISAAALFRAEPTAAALYYQAGVAYEAGDKTQALRMAHRAYKLDANPEHGLLLGKIFIAKGLRAEAGKVLSRNLDSDYRRAYDAAAADRQMTQK